MKCEFMCNLWKIIIKKWVFYQWLIQDSFDHKLSEDADTPYTRMYTYVFEKGTTILHMFFRIKWLTKVK